MMFDRNITKSIAILLWLECKQRPIVTHKRGRGVAVRRGMTHMKKSDRRWFPYCCCESRMEGSLDRSRRGLGRIDKKYAPDWARNGLILEFRNIFFKNHIVTKLFAVRIIFVTANHPS